MIIITGASKGIGKYLFHKFSEDGFEVIGTFNSTNLDCVDDSTLLYKVDISDNQQVSEWVESIKPYIKDVVLINCAGISYSGFAHKADFFDWKKVIDINLIGTFSVIHKFLPFMRNQRFGRIINFSSVIAKLPTLGVSAYAASKAGLVGLTKSLSIENAVYGITVNSINLGYVEIGMGINDVTQVEQEKLKNRIPSGRFCQPIEIYHTVKYLIENEYVNGSDLDLNGGLV